MWKFEYFRADRQWGQIGPYPTEEKAKKERDNMVSFGATCSEPFEVPGEVPKKDGSYVDNKVSIFESYFKKEIAILRGEGITYQISYEFLNTLIQRAELFIGENTPFILTEEDFHEDVPKGKAKEEIGKFKRQREEYLSRVAGIIEREASRYSPVDGSFWESVSEELKKLAKVVETGQILKSK